MAPAWTLLNLVRACTVTASDGRPKRALLDWLGAICSGSGEAPDALATLLSLTVNVIPRDQFDAEARGVLLKASAFVGDARAAANAIDALACFDLEAAVSLAATLGRPSDARLEAVAVQVRGMRDLDRATVRSLRRMLASREPRRVASGLHALGEIARHFQAQDLVYLKARLGFMALTKRLPTFAAHADAMIRRQAVAAARKIADPEIWAALQKMAGQDPDGALAAEMAEYASVPSRRYVSAVPPSLRPAA